VLAGGALVAIAAGALRRRRGTPAGEVVTAQVPPTGQDGVPTGAPSTSVRIREGDR
jgi:hypothetical protein